MAFLCQGGTITALLFNPKPYINMELSKSSLMGTLKPSYFFKGSGEHTMVRKSEIPTVIGRLLKLGAPKDPWLSNPDLEIYFYIIHIHIYRASFSS